MKRLPINHWQTSFAIATFSLLGIIPQIANAYPMYYIVDLGGLGGSTSLGRGVNNAGDVVGIATTDSYSKHGFLWQGEFAKIPNINPFNGNTEPLLVSQSQITDLLTLGGTNSGAFGINDSGEIVGYSDTSSGTIHAFLNSNGNMKDLGTLGGDNSGAKSINNLGQVVGWADTANSGSQAFLYANNQMTSLGTFGGSRSEATSINDLGSIVGWANDENNQSQAFLWENNQMTDLGLLSGTSWSQAFDINNSNQIVGAIDTITGERQAVLWENGQILNLPSLGGNWSQANAINNKGHAVGWSETATSGSMAFHATLWEDGEAIDLNDPNIIRPNSPWVLQEAWNVNDQGDIVGQGIVRVGDAWERHAFLLKESCRVSPQQQNPLLPSEIDGEWMKFNNVPSNLWYDPPANSGFNYQALNGSGFLQISNFPCGIDPDNQFNVFVGGENLGVFGPGDTLDFSQFFDTPVTDFTIVGINAPIDTTDPVAFPIQIAFNNPTADFQIRPVFVDPPVNEAPANNVKAVVPEPATIWSLMGLGLAIIIGDRRRR